MVELERVPWESETFVEGVPLDAGVEQKIIEDLLKDVNCQNTHQFRLEQLGLFATLH